MTAGQRPGGPGTVDLGTLRAHARQAAICLDFDGTLAPIVDDPDEARPLPGVVDLLAALARRFAAAAVVSGRPAAFLADHVAARGVRLVGLYGMETVVDGRVLVDPEVERWRPAVLAAAVEAARHPAVVGSGAWLEHKGLALGIHLRRIKDPAAWENRLRAAAEEIAARHVLRVAPGKMVFELRPPVERDKGDAVRIVISDTGARLAMMVGDDLGDLAAFEALRQLPETGRAGLCVAVRSPESPPELLAAADLVVDGPEGVRDLLAELALGA
jgi:trehalose 6-phosphate phosphatase